jgi:hypothetical protein
MNIVTVGKAKDIKLTAKMIVYDMSTMLRQLGLMSLDISNQLVKTGLILRRVLSNCPFLDTNCTTSGHSI